MLLAIEEEAARNRQSRHSQLHTYDFQASGFYQKCGHRLVGELQGYPPGHTLYWMRKDFK